MDRIFRIPYIWLEAIGAIYRSVTSSLKLIGILLSWSELIMCAADSAIISSWYDVTPLKANVLAVVEPDAQVHESITVFC
jgi:hypothetical protein